MITTTDHTTSTTEQSNSMPIKSVKYDRETRDYCAMFNGEILGWRKTQLQAERLCDDYAFEFLSYSADVSHLDAEEANSLIDLAFAA